MVLYLMNRVMQLNKIFLLLALLACTYANSNEINQAHLVGFEAKYNAYRFGKRLGEANLTLSNVKDNQYRLDYSSKVSAFFLSDKRYETSLFVFENGQLIPHTYQYHRTGTGSNKSIQIDFDNSESKIIINNNSSINWQGQFDNQLYRLDLQLKLASGQTEFSYDLINNRGQLRHYDLKVIGNEQLDLPIGMIEGVKVKIMRKNSSRETHVWFSPQLNYQLVKLQQFRKGKEQGEIRLKSFTPKAKT